MLYVVIIIGGLVLVALAIRSRREWYLSRKIDSRVKNLSRVTLSGRN